LNVQYHTTLYDAIIDAYVFIQAHYYYYSGVFISMLITPFNFKEFIRYTIVSLLLVQITKHYLNCYGVDELSSQLICIILGITGVTALKYIIDEATLKILKAVTDKIVSNINKK
jgi:hypothetical protein